MKTVMTISGQDFLDSQGIGHGFPSFKDSFKLCPDFVWILTAKDKEDMEAMKAAGRKLSDDAKARRLSTEGVKADMIAIGKGIK